MTFKIILFQFLYEIRIKSRFINKFVNGDNQIRWQFLLVYCVYFMIVIIIVIACYVNVNDNKIFTANFIQAGMWVEFC